MNVNENVVDAFQLKLETLSTTKHLILIYFLLYSIFKRFNTKTTMLARMLDDTFCSIPLTDESVTSYELAEFRTSIADLTSDTGPVEVVAQSQGAESFVAYCDGFGVAEMDIVENDGSDTHYTNSPN